MDAEALRDFVDKAGFIFRGRLLERKADEDHAAASGAGETVAAHIEEVLRSTEAMSGLAGKNVVVVTQHAEALRGQHSPILFTQCLSVGQHLLVREIGHVAASVETTRQIAEAVREAEERPLRERIAAASLIVAGEVAESRALEHEFPPKSEHDPLWWVARVALASVLKGRKPRDPVEVVFANSDDHVWFKSPKLHRELRGVFLLHRMTEEETPPGAPRGAFMAENPLDFLPEERRGEAERMLDGGTGDR